jgi:hypothetical protein
MQERWKKACPRRKKRVSGENERIPRARIQVQRGRYHMSALEELFPIVVAVSSFITF